MLIRFFLKIWPALIPLFLYVFWIFVIQRFLLRRILKKRTQFEAQKLVGEKSTEIKPMKAFSLQNRFFVITIYATLIMAILGLILTAFGSL